MPKVSIIVPVYGVEKYLKVCLDSILMQTLKDIEIILVDDGGKDNCPRIIDEYARKDSRIIAVHKQNGGYGHSMNTGMSMATGEYIGIVEPDDFISKYMYEDLYNLAVKNDADIVKSSFYENFDTKDYKAVKKIYWDRVFKLPHNQIFTIKDYPRFLHFHPSVWTCIYKKDFLDKNKIRFVEAPGAGWTDNPFQVQTMCLAKRIIYTDKAYYYWRELNTNPSKDLKDYSVPFKRLDEVHEWLEDNDLCTPDILACLYRRELIYIHIVLGMLTLKTYLAGRREIIRLLKRMDNNIVKNNSYVSVSEKWRLFYFRYFLDFMFIKLRFSSLKELRKKVISVRYNRYEKSIKLFGKELLGKNI